MQHFRIYVDSSETEKTIELNEAYYNERLKLINILLDINTTFGWIGIDHFDEMRRKLNDKESKGEDASLTHRQIAALELLIQDAKPCPVSIYSLFSMPKGYSSNDLLKMKRNCLERIDILRNSVIQLIPQPDIQVMDEVFYNERLKLINYFLNIKTTSGWIGIDHFDVKRRELNDTVSKGEDASLTHRQIAALELLIQDAKPCPVSIYGLFSMPKGYSSKDLLEMKRNCLESIESLRNTDIQVMPQSGLSTEIHHGQYCQ